MLQHSKKSSNGRQFLDCKSEAVAFAMTTATAADFSNNLVRSPHLKHTLPYPIRFVGNPTKRLSISFRFDFNMP